MQLACRFMLAFILKREGEKLALRDISDVEIGKIIVSDREDGWGEHSQNECWFPISYVGRGRNDGQLLNSTHRLSTFLRLSHCEDVCINLEYLQGMAEADLAYRSYTTAKTTPWNWNHPTSDNALGVLFDDLNAKDTSVGLLSVKTDKGCEQVLRCIDAFKSVNEVLLDLDNIDSDDEKYFDEDFFSSLAMRGVWSIEFDTCEGVEVSATSSLAFGFAAPTPQGDRDRRIGGINLSPEGNLLSEVQKKASVLDGDEEIDFEFEICKHDASMNIDPAGFEKYRKSKAKWVFDDLENKIIVEIKEKKNSVKIYVYSPSSA